MGIMFLTVQSLYLKGQLTEKGLNNAISKGWITPDEKTKILKMKK